MALLIVPLWSSVLRAAVFAGFSVDSWSMVICGLLFGLLVCDAFLGKRHVHVRKDIDP